MSRHHADWERGFEGGGGMRLSFPALTPAVKVILLVNIGIFLVVFFSGIVFSDSVEDMLVHWLSMSPELWTSGYPFVLIWQPLTSGFLHQAPTHIFWNMLQLYFFGTMLEGTVGSRRFAWFYISAILLSSVASGSVDLITGPRYGIVDGQETMLWGGLGASGGVLGVIVAAAVLFPRAQVILLIIPMQLWVLASFVVALDAFAILSAWKGGVSDGIGHWAHLGGAMWGFVAARRGWIWIDPLERLAARRKAAASERKRSDEERMDELLAKIHREGMGSLTRREREFLKRVSSRR